VKKYNQRVILPLILSVVFISHFSSKNVTSFDSRWSIPTALSIIREGDISLDEYEKMIPANDHRIEIIDGHIYSRFPAGVYVIAFPFVYIVDKLAAHRLLFNTDDLVKQSTTDKMELFIASIIIAITAIFIYLLACLFLNRKYSLLVTFIFAFCTPAWSTASRALWQHGPSMLMLTITLYLILLAGDKPRLIQFASIPLAFSYVVRPTNSIPVFLLSLFVLIQYKKYFFRYFIWAMSIAVPFLLFNFTIYHSCLSPYYLPQRIGSNPHFFEALAGNLVSPARGLFIFSPILLFAICGVVLKIENKQLSQLDYFLFGIIFLHWIAISSFRYWWAGHSFGPRFFSDLIPYFIYFLIPTMAGMSELKDIRKVIFVSVFSCFILLSFFIHFRGANNWDVYVWNVKPVNVDVKPARVWDWKDIQFLRGIK